MKNFISRIVYPKASLPILWLRIVGGGLMLVHGYPKLMKIIEGAPYKWADPIGLGPGISLWLTGFAEILCAGMVLLGFRTRLATIPLMITMFVAGAIHHAGDPFGEREGAILYFAIYLSLFFLGSGKYSLDNAFNKK